MIIRNLKTTVLAALVISSLYSMHPAYAEKGVTTATRIQRHQSSTTISTETTQTESRSGETSKGISISPPNIGIIIVPDRKDIPFTDFRQSRSLASYNETKKEKEESFYRHGVLAMVKSGKKWGLIGTDGRITLEPTYKILIPEKNGIFRAGDKKKDMHFIDKEGNPAQPEKANAPQPASYSENGLYGFKNPDGSVLLAPRYKSVLAGFSEGIAFVTTTRGEKIAIDENGRSLFPVSYDDIRPYRYGVAEFRRKVSTFSGKSLLGIYATSIFNQKDMEELDEYGTAYDGIKRGYIDREGKVIIDSKNDEVYPMTPYGTIVKNNGLTSFVSPSGRVLIAPGHYKADTINIEDARLALQNERSKKYGIFDMGTGTQLVDFLYDDINLLGFDRAFIKNGSDRFLINASTGEILADLPKNTGSVHFNDQPVTWVFKVESYYGIMDKDGRLLYEDVKDPLTDVTPFRHGYSGGQKNNKKWGILKSDGTWLVEPAYDDIELL